MSKPTKNQAEKRKQQDYAHWLRGYRDGYAKGFDLGKRKGREDLQAELRALLNAERASHS